MPQIDERNLTKAAFASVANAAPDKVGACKQLLRIICRRSKIISLHNDPLAQFVNEQVHLTTSELLNKLENQLMSHKDIFDDCENLCHLFTMLLADNGPVCVAFSSSIHQITMAVAELSNLLERMARAKVVNWPAIGQTFVSQAKEANALQSHNSFRSYIPSIGDFDMISLVGAGTMSQVYAVVHRPTGHQFALKITPRAKLTSCGKGAGSTVAATQDQSAAPATIEPTAADPTTIAFIDRVVGSMTHDPMVCRVHAVWVGRPDVDIALIEYIEDDVDVLQVVDYLGYLTTEDAVLVIFQALLGIEHMHLRGFIHRDVKPSNFLIDKNGRVRLTDFVNAKICRGHYPTKKVLTSYFKRTAQEFKDHDIAGTLAYTSPEVLQKKSYGRACDWWSLGASTYKLTTGKVPFRGEDATKVKERIISEELRWPKAEETPHSATPEIKEFVYDLLKKNPIHRLGTKMYSDLKDHQAMAKAASMLRRVQTVKEAGEVRDARTKLYIIAYSEIDRIVIKDMDQTVSAIIENRAPYAQFSYLGFNDIQDLPLDKHYRLLTFAHPKFRRFVDRQSGTFHGSDKYLTVITPPEPDLDYMARDDGETLLEATKQETVAQRMSQVQLLDVCLNLQMRYCFIRSIDLKLELAKGEGQVTYPVVVKTRQKGIEEDPTEVIFGDIIAAIEKVWLNGQPLKHIDALFDNLMRGKRTGRFHCQVFANNVFRFAHSHLNTALSMITTKVPVELTLTAGSSRKKGFIRTHILKLWNPESKEFVSNHIIMNISPSLTVSAGGTIFYGDVLTQVNGKDTAGMSVAEVQRQLSSRSPVQVTIVELSVLRRKDLHEAGLGGEDAHEMNLERMSANT